MLSMKDLFAVPLSLSYYALTFVFYENPILWKLYFSKQKINRQDQKTTPADLIGPELKFFSPLRTNGKLYEKSYKHNWTKLILNGQVFDEEMNPIPFAELNFWQADSDGYYYYLGYEYRGKIKCDKNGKYQVETVLPGCAITLPEKIKFKVFQFIEKISSHRITVPQCQKFLNLHFHRAPHIHVQVLLDHKVFTTQLYFNYQGVSLRDVVSDFYKKGKEPLWRNVLELEELEPNLVKSEFNFVVATLDLKKSFVRNLL